MIKKKCTRCNKIKPLDEFYTNKRKNKKSKDGLNRWCKSCIDKRYPLSEKDKEANKQSARKGWYKHAYGITLEQYDKMFEEQNGVCVICGGINLDGRRLAVDHDHKTGKIRQLLCLKCNALIGSIESFGYLLDKAVKYLEKHNVV